MSEVPPYVTPAEIAKACGMQTRKARRFLARAGILEKIDTRCVVAESRLRERLPDMYERVFWWFEQGSQSRP